MQIADEQGDTINLKLITAYWCNYASPDYEKRFFWAGETVDDMFYEISAKARLTLCILADSAPDEQATAYFAAGPLENYINTIVRCNDVAEAEFIMSDSKLSGLLQYVWGDIDKFKLLARDSAPSVSNKTILKVKLESLSLKEICGFWCHVSASQFVENYAHCYELVLDKLLDDKKRNKAVKDLASSAPDKKTRAYLESDIFILRK